MQYELDTENAGIDDDKITHYEILNVNMPRF